MGFWTKREDGICHAVMGLVSRASCKMIFSPNLFVMLKILSSEYQLYVCGKIFRMPRS
jgi:hypothetical protein